MACFHSRNRIILAVAVAGAGAGAGAIAVGEALLLAQSPPRASSPNAEHSGSFVRADNPDMPSREVLEAMGVNSIGFVFRTPPGMAAVITTLARDGQGKLIPRLSGRAYLNPRDDKHGASGRFRITRIDPGATNESYRGNVRWELRFANQGNTNGLNHTTINCWQSEDEYQFISNWESQANFVGLKAGEDYSLSEIEALSAETKHQPSEEERLGIPLKFDLQVTFRISEPTNASPLEYEHLKEPLDGDE